MAIKRFNQTSGGIEWYCEQRGAGPYLVLVPSGEGDCAAYEPVAASLAEHFTVLTFDTPGFSRSGTPENDAEISPYLLGRQIAGLVASLGIRRASFYGCSSGGVAVLDLVTDHAEIVSNAVVHEVAALKGGSRQSSQAGPLQAMLALDDAGIVDACQKFFRNFFNEDPQAWDALGADYHARLARNYVTWVRQYVGKIDLSLQQDIPGLHNRPLSWTVGALSATSMNFENFMLCNQAGIVPTMLPCRHFPQVSIPQKLADHIRDNSLPHAA